MYKNKYALRRQILFNVTKFLNSILHNKKYQTTNVNDYAKNLTKFKN